MKRSLYAYAAAALLAATITTSARAATDIHVSIGDRDQGATLVFHSQPRTVVIPDTRVYYVQNYDYDLYRCGDSWYYIDDGYWYRAASWRGPFVQIRVSAVPRMLVSVPLRYRHHWRGVSYNNASYYRSRDRYRHDHRGGDREARGHGHGRGNRWD
jgi:hypothetical protein